MESDVSFIVVSPDWAFIHAPSLDNRIFAFPQRVLYYLMYTPMCVSVCRAYVSHNSLSIFKFMRSLSLELYLDCAVLDKYLNNNFSRTSSLELSSFFRHFGLILVIHLPLRNSRVGTTILMCFVSIVFLVLSQTVAETISIRARP